MIGRAWAWMRADWKRLLILPAIVTGFVALLRLALGNRQPSPPLGPVATLTPDQGEAVKTQADTTAAETISEAAARAAADKAAAASKWGG